MESLFLAQLIGLYLLIVGTIVTIRRASFMLAISDLVKNKGVLITIAFVELAAGLALVLHNPQITLDWVGIISLVGWMMIVEGILYLVLPSKKIQQMVRTFNTPTWYVLGGLLSVVAGGYLSAVGFGLI